MITSTLLDKITQEMALALAISTPTLAFYAPGWSSLALYILVLLSAISFIASRGRMPAGATPVAYWWPLLGTALLFISATLIAQTIHGRWHSSSFEKSLRTLCLLPALYLFSKISIERLKHVQWGFIVATWAGAWSLIFPKVTSAAGTSGAARPNTLAYTLYNTIGFANMMMLFSSFIVASMFWQLTRFRKLEIALKVLTAGVGYYAMLLSQTRTSFLAIPVFLLIALFSTPRFSRRTVMLFLCSIIVILTVLSTSSIVRERTEEAYSEAVQCRENPTTDTSICIRCQLLRAAGYLFMENPWFGAGDGTLFKQNMQMLAARGVISTKVADGWGETHNDISHVAATYGIVGLVPFLLVLFGLPAFYLAKQARLCHNACAQIAASMGLLLVLGFFSFGMTEMMFRTMRTLSTYLLFVALFLALSGPRSALTQHIDSQQLA